MTNNIKSSIALLLALTLSGCDNALNYAAASYLKMSMKDVCGEEDPKCVAAVDAQFDPCHSRYEKDWAAYMNAGVDEEDELLAVYSKSMYACIVDADGEPYFVFDPQG